MWQHGELERQPALAQYGFDIWHPALGPAQAGKESIRLTELDRRLRQLLGLEQPGPSADADGMFEVKSLVPFATYHTADESVRFQAGSPEAPIGG